MWPSDHFNINCPTGWSLLFSLDLLIISKPRYQTSKIWNRETCMQAPFVSSNKLSQPLHVPWTLFHSWQSKNKNIKINLATLRGLNSTLGKSSTTCKHTSKNLAIFLLSYFGLAKSSIICLQKSLQTLATSKSHSLSSKLIECIYNISTYQCIQKYIML